jgi:hypothetical protein
MMSRGTALTLAAALAVGAVMIGGNGPTTLTAQQGYQVSRTPEGHPDLEGIWQVINSAEANIQDHGAELGVAPGRAVVENNEIPYQPWALEQQQKNNANRATTDPARNCGYPGVPRIMYQPFPFKIVQTQDFVGMYFEFGHHIRFIHTTGMPHHEGIPFWMGDSRGSWDGDTFVIDSKNFTENTWFDRAGNFHSEELHVVERLTRTGQDHIRYEATIEDPKVFTRPWKMSMPLYRRVEADAQLMEYECFAMQVFDGLWEDLEKIAEEGGIEGANQ